MGTPDTAVLTVFDDDPAGGYIKFSSANYNVSEGEGAATITVERIGSLAQTVTVDYATDESSPRVHGPVRPDAWQHHRFLRDATLIQLWAGLALLPETGRRKPSRC
jgi:hypothetical protein